MHTVRRIRTYHSFDTATRILVSISLVLPKNIDYSTHLLLYRHHTRVETRNTPLSGHVGITGLFTNNRICFVIQPARPTSQRSPMPRGQLSERATRHQTHTRMQAITSILSKEFFKLLRTLSPRSSQKTQKLHSQSARLKILKISKFVQVDHGGSIRRACHSKKYYFSTQKLSNKHTVTTSMIFGKSTYTPY